MEDRFELILLNEAIDFIKSIDKNASIKIMYNIRKSKVINDPELFKKLSNEIWEFRTLYNKKYYRLFAFWDNRDKSKTIVVATHGLIKKTKKTPKSEIQKAIEIMKRYFKKNK